MPICSFRLIWEIETGYIQGQYDLDFTGSITKIINAGDLAFLESDVYQDILDKITQEGLQIDPSLNL